MKRFFSACLAAILLFLGSACALADAFTVASLTEMSGFFFTDMWGGTAADKDVRKLIHGYATVAFGEDTAFDRTVVQSARAQDDEDGNRVYTITLSDGLEYSDGKPIQARDYVFSVLLQSSGILRDMGADAAVYSHLLGYEEYEDGGIFSGVRLLGDNSFSLTIKAACLPYFNELAYAYVVPYPLHVIAPKCAISDKGKGARITGSFTKKLLSKTILDEKSGYLANPSVTSGPYKLDEYDSQSHTALFSLNDKYVGNFEGQKPSLKSIQFLSVKPDDMFAALEAGEVNLLNRVSGAQRINEGLAMVEDGHVRAANYPSNGLSMLRFTRGEGEGLSLNIRRAIAYLLDREDLAERYLQNFGAPVYGYYGLGQWMVSSAQNGLSGIERYPLNLYEARKLLGEDGWIYKEDGTPYDPVMGGVRYRQTEGGYEKLSLKWARPFDEAAFDVLSEMIHENLPLAGFEVTYVDAEDEAYDMISVSEHFGHVFDPHDSVSLDPSLAAIAQKMRRTNPGDQAAYLSAWLEYQTRYAEVLPALPLYSNTYYDFYSVDVEGYNVATHEGWADAILYIN